jgi:cytochrome c551/c552
MLNLQLDISSHAEAHPMGGPARVPGSRQRRRARAAIAAVLTVVALGSLCGCGASGATKRTIITSSEVPSYAAAPFTHQQQLIERGAHLFLTDGCSACHAISGKQELGPSFARLAGNYVRLTDGHRVLVSERFLREALLDPHATEVKGYPLQPMLTAVARLHLQLHRADVDALAAFIEQIGPEGA